MFPYFTYLFIFGWGSRDPVTIGEAADCWQAAKPQAVNSPICIIYP